MLPYYQASYYYTIKEVLKAQYSKQLQSGKVVLRVIDISKKENEAIVEKYQVTWSSLFLVSHKNGKEGWRVCGWSRTAGCSTLHGDGLRVVAAVKGRCSLYAGAGGCQRPDHPCGLCTRRCLPVGRGHGGCPILLLHRRV